VFGKGTYLDDLLTALGGTNATDAQGWASFSLEDLVRINPDAIILIRPGSDGQNVAYSLGVVWDQDINAVNRRKVAMLTNADSFMPSSGIIGVAQEMRSLLERFEAEPQ
jgi:iron complex transport system substrate-binding protein